MRECSHKHCHINTNYKSWVSHEDPDKWLRIDTTTRSSPFVATLCTSVVVTNERSDPLEKKGTYGQRRSINSSPEEATGSYLSIPVLCVCGLHFVFYRPATSLQTTKQPRSRLRCCSWARTRHEWNGSASRRKRVARGLVLCMCVCVFETETETESVFVCVWPCWWLPGISRGISKLIKCVLTFVV